MIIRKIRQWWQSLRYSVLLDPADNSVTLSKKLFQHIVRNNNGSDSARVFVFRISDTDTFAFMVNPPIEQSTQLCDIQVNDKYKCVGFETLCPSVGYMFAAMSLPAHRQVRLSVSINTNVDGKFYYLLMPPRHDKHTYRK
jgi:hypothetical protein